MNINPNLDEDYKNTINELDYLYRENPTVVTKNLKKALITSNNEIYGNTSKLSNKDIDIFYIVFIAIFLAIFGIIISHIVNVSEAFLAMYFFGGIFFAAGLGVGLTQTGGIVFLFSHGLTGFALMIGPSLSSIFSNSIMTDNPQTIYKYLICIFIVFIINLFLSIYYSLSDTLKLKNHFILIPITIYSIIIILIDSLPLYIDKLYYL